MRTTSRIFLLLLASTIFLTACKVRVTVRRPQHVFHVVCVWLKDHGGEQKRDQLIATGKALAKIPGIVRLSAGRCMPSDRPIVDSSYDVAYVMEFRDAAAMKAYVTHPDHESAVRMVLKPLARKVVVYDFQAE